MRTVCVWREEADYARDVQDWLDEFERRTGREIESMDPDKETGFCEVYDVVEYPTIMALDDNGTVLASWRGRQLPRFDEVNYYMI